MRMMRKCLNSPIYRYVRVFKLGDSVILRGRILHSLNSEREIKLPLKKMVDRRYYFHFRPIIMRSGFIWTLPSKSDSLLVQLLQTTSPYSKTCPINPTYKRIRELISIKWLSRLRRNKRDHSFSQISSISFFPM